MRGNEWKDKPFSIYDVIYHIAAIVHVKKNDTEKYFNINRDLAVSVVKRTKAEGVKQFVFLSTMGVYETEIGFINGNTKPNPKTPYAKSKLEAESLLSVLADDSFRVAALRPLLFMANTRDHPRLAGMALKLPVFPKIKNERSMIFIDNLSEFVRQAIDKELSELFFPQNKEYVNTTETFSKVFGSFVYEKKMPGGPCKELDYETCSFEESIERTEK
jgi:UDP-glucose 4-epimerase